MRRIFLEAMQTQLRLKFIQSRMRQILDEAYGSNREAKIQALAKAIKRFTRDGRRDLAAAAAELLSELDGRR